MIDDKQLTQYVEHFFDDNKLKKEELRQYINSELSTFKSQIHDILYLEKNEQYWQKVSDKVAASDDQPKLLACQRIKTMDQIIDFWIREGVESPERFEFFIISKAAEINSGDLDRDYYHALLIRHDQLLSVHYNIQQAIKHLENCLQHRSDDITKTDDFKYFMVHTMEDRIYKVAQLMYKTRKNLGKL